jgi:poly-gamma-glutamate synthesis protein (capsule biosynthesis protein)
MGFDGRRTARATAARPGILWLDDESLAAAARQFGPDTFDVAMVHGGEEWTSAPTPGQQRLYRRLIEAGADLVIGSHPHVLQGMEAMGGGLIAWSLGNFLFPGMDGTKGGEDSAILRLGVYRGAIRYVQSYPVRLKGGTVRRQVTEPAPAGVPPMGVP